MALTNYKLGHLAGVAVVSALICMLPESGVAQSPATEQRTGPVADSQSLSHLAAKTATNQIGIITTSFIVFGIGTGSVVSGAALAASMIPIGLTVYPLNEYLWDYFSPPQSGGSSFDATGSVVRNTWKYLTFKTGTTITKFTAIYIYTGSVASTLAMGSVTSVIFPMVYYANNIGWDWYDWYIHSTLGTSGQKTVDLAQPKIY